MKTTNTLMIPVAKGLVLMFTVGILSCNSGVKPGNADQNMMDGDDREQPFQDQDSVNRVLNQNHGSAPDTVQNMK